MTDPSDNPVVGLLELLLSEMREARESRAQEQARHLQALAAQHACTRKVVRWFGAFILSFGAIAAFAVARPSLLWLLSG
jgi:hypothetical protein